MQPIPQQQATLTLTTDSLLSLPLGAEYRASQGRAHATVKNEGGLIVVYATCDSLQALVEQYERTVNAREADVQHLENTVRTVKEQRTNARRMALWLLVAGMAVGSIITISTITIINKIKHYARNK